MEYHTSIFYLQGRSGSWRLVKDRTKLNHVFSFSLEPVKCSSCTLLISIAVAIMKTRDSVWFGVQLNAQNHVGLLKNTSKKTSKSELLLFMNLRTRCNASMSYIYFLVRLPQLSRYPLDRVSRPPSNFVLFGWTVSIYKKLNSHTHFVTTDNPLPW